MRLSIGETAARMDVSIRTLRYYDEIGLLKPTELSEAGYRYYDEHALLRLQQILFFRELAFPLEEIAALLSRPDYDPAPALCRQRELLLLKRRHLDGLLRQLDEIMEEQNMQKQEITSADIDAARRRYAAETRERWGATAEYAESERRDAARTDGDRAGIAADADRIFAAFAACRSSDPADPAVQALVAEWQAHITKYYYPCTKEILAGLGQMYTADARFTAGIDRFGDGTARLMSAAIAVFCTT